MNELEPSMPQWGVVWRSKYLLHTTPLFFCGNQEAHLCHDGCRAGNVQKTHPVNMQNYYYLLLEISSDSFQAASCHVLLSCGGG